MSEIKDTPPAEGDKGDAARARLLALGRELLARAEREGPLPVKATAGASSVLGCLDPAMEEARDGLLHAYLTLAELGVPPAGGRAVLALLDSIVEAGLGATIDALHDAVCRLTTDAEWVELQAEVETELAVLNGFERSVDGALIEVFLGAGIDPLSQPFLDRGAERGVYLCAGTIHQKKREGRPPESPEAKAATLVADLRALAPLVQAHGSVEQAARHLVGRDESAGAVAKRWGRAMDELARLVAFRPLIHRLMQESPDSKLLSGEYSGPTRVHVHNA